MCYISDTYVRLNTVGRTRETPLKLHSEHQQTCLPALYTLRIIVKNLCFPYLQLINYSSYWINLKTQSSYKKFYDHDIKQINYWVGDCIFIRFPAEERHKGCKLSDPWHRPYQFESRKYSDVTTTRIYFLEKPQVQVHQQRITRYLPELVTVHDCYGSKKWVEDLHRQKEQNIEIDPNKNMDAGDAEQDDEQYNDEDKQRVDCEICESTGHRDDHSVTLF